MIYKPIYKPEVRALEYGDLALNIYTGCNHGCDYCYARKMKQRFAQKKGGCSFKCPEPRVGIVESVKHQLQRERLKNKIIHLCFTCDPYPADIDTTATREIIAAIKESGNYVQILTKGGARAERDFDLLGESDLFGVTFTSDALFETHRREPHAAPSGERLVTLQHAKRRGITTWVSCEPVFQPEAVYSLIKSGDYIDLFKIGMMNHEESDINWSDFGAECVRRCEEYGRDYYIKEGLREAMAKGGTLSFSDCPYWNDDRCTGFNCCTERFCPHARQYQPWIFDIANRSGEE